MRRIAILFVAAATLGFAAAQQTTPPMAATYDALADAILSLKQAEHEFVVALIDGHYRAASAAMEAGDRQRAAAEMALFANEGDNAVAGVRKRLLDGGHHHNAEGERQGVYEPGFVIVTRAAKAAILEAAAAMRAAPGEAGARAAWDAFVAAAGRLLARP